MKLPKNRVAAKLERLRATNEPNACWEWGGALDKDGYARARGATVGVSSHRAHRVAYTFFVGPIPEGKDLDHLCRNRRCVNPAHLEPVTVRENTYRGEAVTAHNRLKTHCSNGHLFTPETIRVVYSPSGLPGRRCRLCERIWGEAARRKRGQKVQGPVAHCKRGHAFTPENTIPAGRWKQCRACKNMKQRERNQRMV